LPKRLTEVESPVEDVRMRKGGLDPARQRLLFREVNAHIRRMADGSGSSQDELEFVCECGHPRCLSTVQLPLSEYERIRLDDSLFVVAPGHETDTTTAERNGRYVVVTASVAA
jgi:hypothetical protein